MENCRKGLTAILNVSSILTYYGILISAYLGNLGNLENLVNLGNFPKNSQNLGYFLISSVKCEYLMYKQSNENYLLNGQI